jgi:asparagine synthase (glutamine-hydrolysing)
MSVQFGRWNFEGQPPALDYIGEVSAALAPYGPDSNESYSNGGVTILYRAFHTTKESHSEVQPHISRSGAVMTWDGRLDNRVELISKLADSVAVKSTDVEIVAAAFEKWGGNCFAKLIGDWALSIWNPITRSLILAKDAIGKRHLYYSLDEHNVTWCTIIDPLVLFAGTTFAICEEYVASWFSYFPAAHLTPYVGIQSVPPSSSVAIRDGKHTVNKYWDFDPDKRIRYSTDAEYEEHFRAVFADAIRRNLRSDKPILAELSGGMDSSCIVCMADMVIARGTADTPRLDTISCYDDRNPNWGERPFFTKVEQKRGRAGCHIDVGAFRLENVPAKIAFASDFEDDRFAATPRPNSSLSEITTLYAEYVASEGYRVVFSGFGGEEATGGGVPTPRPELQNHLARARLNALVHQLNAWAKKMNKPRFPLLWDAARGFFPPGSIDMPKETRPGPWLNPGFVRRNRAALWRYPSRLKVFGPLPSFQDHLAALNFVRSVLSFYMLNAELLCEKRYPYLDRDLLEFTYAIPRERLVRVGERRSLMRRALVGIAPQELLNRKRRPIASKDHSKNSSPGSVSSEWPSWAEIGEHLVGSRFGIIDEHGFLDALEKAQREEIVPSVNFRRTLLLESWLRHLMIRGVLPNTMPTEERSSAPRLVKTRNSKPGLQFNSSAS